MSFTPKLCPNPSCSNAKNLGGKFHRKGFFVTKRTNSRFRRYQCKNCLRYFSFRTFQPDYRHKKRDLNPLLAHALSESMSIRAASRFLKMTYKNTFKKFLWLGRQAKQYRERLAANATTLFVDEMETIEHNRSQGEKDRHRNRLHEFEGKRAFDPMFCLNQRCAKLRSDIKRLVRRSWCTTKKPENLQLHLDIYLMQQYLAA